MLLGSNGGDDDMADDDGISELERARRRAGHMYRCWREACDLVERLERAAGIRAGAAGSVRVRDDEELDEQVSLEGIFGPPPGSPR
jgi:hypothetical protein